MATTFGPTLGPSQPDTSQNTTVFLHEYQAAQLRMRQILLLLLVYDFMTWSLGTEESLCLEVVVPLKVIFLFQ
jgi:hypothetical protein